MKNSIKWVLIILLLIGIIAGATVLYNNLADKHKGDSLVEISSKEMDIPDFKVVDYKGKDVKLSDYVGKPIVLNFWATWCHYCKEEMPDFNKAFKEHPEVQFMMVNVTDGVRETVESAREYIDKEKYEFDVFFDIYKDAVEKYEVTAYPTTYFIDAEGNVVSYSNGALDYESLIHGIDMITK